MLSHPWLQLEDNYDTKMTDDEYEMMMLKVRDMEQKKKLADALLSTKEKQSWTFSECELSDADLNAADNSLSESEDSLSLGHGDSDDEILDLFAPGYKNGKALNNSF